MGHYNEYYEEQDRDNRIYMNLQCVEEASKIRREFLESTTEDVDSKGWHYDLVEKLAACRAHRFREDELNELLTEIVKHLHRR